MIKKIILKQFRNHKHLELEFNKPFVYIHGNNGIGKTSILEGIYFCATTKSHRSSDEKELIFKGEPFASVKLWTETDKYDLVLSKTGKRASINNIEKRRMSDFIGHLSVVMFAPEDLDLIKGSPATRRQFLDLEWMQLDKGYLRHLNLYKHILKQRNALLKKIKLGDDETFLNILGEQLYDVGIQIIEARRKFIDQLNQYIKEVYPKFSTHHMELIYEPDVEIQAYKKHLTKQQKQDILYQTTLAGPHRDDFYIAFNGFDAKSYASQGEQRLMVVALKLGLLKLIEATTQKQVCLLLDDVLSELDQEKQALFLKHLPKEHQIIMNSALPVKGDHIQMIHLNKE